MVSKERILMKSVHLSDLMTSIMNLFQRNAQRDHSTTEPKGRNFCRVKLIFIPIFKPWFTLKK